MPAVSRDSPFNIKIQGIGGEPVAQWKAKNLLKYFQKFLADLLPKFLYIFSYFNLKRPYFSFFTGVVNIVHE